MFDNINNCVSCKLGYYLDNSNVEKITCKPVSTLCRLYDEFKGTCLSCPDNYLFENGGCVKIHKSILYCKKTASNG